MLGIKFIKVQPRVRRRMKKKLLRCLQSAWIASLILLIWFPCRVSAQEVEWIRYKDTHSGQTIIALFSHPHPGLKMPVVIYNHGKIIEIVGYQGGVRKGYDVADFVRALPENGYAAIAPIRPADTGFDFGPFVRGTMQYLKQRPDIDSGHIGMIGFSKGGYMTLEAACNLSELKAAVVMSPARPQKPLSETELRNIKAPLLVTLGKREKDDEIGLTTESAIVGVMRRLGKEIEYRDDYNGNHRWFHKVRREYWQDIINFLDKHLK